MTQESDSKRDEQKAPNRGGQPAEPFSLFRAWFQEAQEAEPNNPNAMALSTVGADQMPNVRMVLLKGMDEDGFVFYTNYESIKGQELLTNPKAALCFYWKTLQKQIRIQGMIYEVPDEEADDYFASRPKDSQIGAWASEQSRPMEGRFVLERRIAKFAAKYALGAVDRPPHWSGFRLRPLRIEFWQEKPFRLHDRLVFERNSIKEDRWATTKLFP